MAVLSQRTCGVLARLMERWRRSEIDLFFFEMEVPDDLVCRNASNKLDLALGTIRLLYLNGMNSKLLEIARAALPEVFEEDKQELGAALLRDGLVVSGQRILSDLPETAVDKTGLEELVERNADLSVVVLRHHLSESEKVFKNGHWGSTVGEARKFIEQLLVDIATNSSAKRGESPALNRPGLVRQYLKKCGFLDSDEKDKLIDGVYGYFSGEGSHPKISEQSTARACLTILWGIGFYLLEKYEAWKQNGFQP